MVSSLESSSLYFQLMALLREAMDTGKKLPTTSEHHIKRDDVFPRTAPVFTAALTIGELASASHEPAETEALTVAHIALLVPIVYVLGQLGPYGDIPEDIRVRVAELLADFEAKAPALAGRLRTQLLGATTGSLERAS